MKEQQIIIQSSGMVTRPEVHDGLLVGIRVDHQQKNSILEFLTFTEESVQFHLGKVKYLLANEFRQGNIASEIFIYNAEHIPERGLQELAFLKEGDPYLHTLKELCKHERLYFFELESSYGCRFQALCGTITCYK